MYADRRRAFEARIGELFNDHKAAYPVRNMSNNAWRDLGGRILSALEDSFQMGKKLREDEHCQCCFNYSHDEAPSPTGSENNG